MKYFIIIFLFSLIPGHKNVQKVIPLFKKFPCPTIPHISLAHLPTPAYKSNGLSNLLQQNIFIKRDDLTGGTNNYGGNKVRKLEFLLAEALKKNCKQIVAHGCSTAVAWYAHQIGIPCTLFVQYLYNSPVVRNNFLISHYKGAHLRIFKTTQERQFAIETILEKQPDIYFIPAGSSNSLGTIGYVNAAFELKQQIEMGEIPEPDYIYVPIGSCGTTAGLLLGITLSGLHSKIIAVTTQPEITAEVLMPEIKTLFFETYTLLANACTAIPKVTFPEKQIFINTTQCGPYYEFETEAVIHAAKILFANEGITLETTYSAKALAALIHDVRNGFVDADANLLFWNTYCGTDFSHLTKKIDYHDLPKEVHPYFE